MQLPTFTKYAPIPHPNRKPSIKTVLDHINALGWVVSVLGLISSVILIIAASRRIISWPLALLLTGAFVVFWYLLIFREARYEVNGELIDMGCNDFPNN